MDKIDDLSVSMLLTAVDSLIEDVRDTEKVTFEHLRQLEQILKLRSMLPPGSSEEVDVSTEELIRIVRSTKESD